MIGDAPASSIPTIVPGKKIRPVVLVESIRAGLPTHPADGDRRLVDAEPEVVARAAMSDGVALRRLTPAEDAGLERLFFELTTSGASTPSTRTDSIHHEPRGATA